MEINEFLEGLSPSQKAIMQFLDQEIISLPGIELKSRYKLPFYYRYSWICYLNPLKAGGVELCFTRGYLMRNDSGLLDAKGRAMILGITYSDISEIDVPSLREIVHEAIRIDKEIMEKKRGK